MLPRPSPLQLLSVMPSGCERSMISRRTSGNVLLVVRTVDAGDVEIAGPVGLAGGVDGEPIGMRPVELLVRHGWNPCGPTRPGRPRGPPGQFAVKVAVAQRRPDGMQRELAGIVGEDAAGVDDDALGLGPFPMLPPPGDVVASRVDLGDVGLAPAIRAAIPGTVATALSFFSSLWAAGMLPIVAAAATALMNSRRSMPSPISVSLRRGRTLAPVSRHRDIFLDLGCQLVEIDVADTGQQLGPVLARGHRRVLLPVPQGRLQMLDGRGLLLGLAGLVEERQLRRTQDLLRRSSCPGGPSPRRSPIVRRNSLSAPAAGSSAIKRSAVCAWSFNASATSGGVMASIGLPSSSRSRKDRMFRMPLPGMVSPSMKWRTV